MGEEARSEGKEAQSLGFRPFQGVEVEQAGKSKLLWEHTVYPYYQVPVELFVENDYYRMHETMDTG